MSGARRKGWVIMEGVEFDCSGKGRKWFIEGVREEERMNDPSCERRKEFKRTKVKDGWPEVGE